MEYTMDRFESFGSDFQGSMLEVKKNPKYA